jgi:FkbM family methyltransferase
MLKTHTVYSATYNALLALASWKQKPILKKIWGTLWRWQLGFPGLVASKLHGQPVVLTNGHYYPLVNIWHPLFNQPLFALAEFMIRERKRNIKIVDVGAAVGDTVLMLEANFPGKIDGYLCVDGDPQFFSFQEYNLSSVSHKTQKVFSLLSDEVTMVGSIEKTNMTTGSALGETKVMSRTLDQIAQDSNFSGVDLIKIDVDGFDGKVLGGAQKILLNDKPGVVFEWNTPYFHKTGNEILQPFEVLHHCGYNRFIWFNNLGEFTHVQFGLDVEALHETDKISKLQLDKTGLHYDVVALHRDCQIEVAEFVHFALTQRKRSGW